MIALIHGEQITIMGSSTSAETHLSPIFLRIYEILYSAFGAQHWWPGDTPSEIMVGAILTQNTNWRNVSRAIDNIKRAGLMNPRKLLKQQSMVPDLIRPAGYYKVKSKRLVAFLTYFVKHYDGDIERMKRKKTEALRNELLSIQGIGHETADSILLYATGHPVFVIDSYTRRIFSRHNIFKYDQPYDQIRHLFEHNLPRSVELYNEYHALLVRLGKEYCKRNEPLCDTCPLCNIF